jgi:hypothetical protein
VWSWLTGGLLAGSAMGVIAMRWELALLAVPALAIDLARRGRGRRP